MTHREHLKRYCIGETVRYTPSYKDWLAGAEGILLDVRRTRCDIRTEYGVWHVPIASIVDPEIPKAIAPLPGQLSLLFP
jgi:hypothetical protein